MLSYWAYAAGWRVVRWLPEGIAYAVFRSIAAIAYRRGGRSLDRLRSNLQVVTGLATPEIEPLVQSAMRSYLRYWCDAFRLPDWSSRRILERVQVVGEEHLVNATAQGSGAVVSLPHSGNWDHAGAWAVLRGWSVVTVAEVLKPQRLFERFLAYRARLGFEVHPFGSPRVVATLAQRLREGALVALVSDRDLSATGVEVEFFGRKAKMPKGPASLALTTGVDLIPAHVAYDRRDILITFYPPVKTDEVDRERAIADLTQKVADSFSRGIAAHPEDWHMLQRVWID